MKRFWVIFILVLAFVGLADSAYLAEHESSGVPLICNVNGLSDCNVVAASPYSRLFGIPLAEYGVLFYSIMFVLAALELLVYDRFLRRVLQIWSLLGLLASIWFTFNQVFFIGAFCIYCLVSASISLLIFIFATRIEPLRDRRLLPVVLPSPSSPAPRVTPRSLPMPPAP